jgi:methionine-rich copper-binding protein CopC
MAVIAFACFVVVTQHAVAHHYISQTVFEAVKASSQRRVQLPDYQFSKTVGTDLNALPDQLLGFGVGDFDNK